MQKIDEIINNRDCKTALKELKAYIKDEPEHAIAYLKIGYCSIQTKQYDNAQKAFDRAEELSSGIEARAGLQLMYLDKGDLEKSITAGGDVLTIDPFNITARLRIADAFMRMENFSKAEK